jgi:NADPH2:quinone reductase
VLVHGAAGGVGSAAIQVAKGLGANVIGCVSTVEKGEVALALGADSVVIGDNFREQLDQPVDLIVDPVGGGQRVKESLNCLAPEGRIVVVGFASGQIPHVRLNRLLLRNIDVRGCNFGVFASDAGSREAVTRRLHDLVTAGTISPLIGSVYPIEKVPAALNELAERRAVGKLVATVGG